MPFVPVDRIYDGHQQLHSPGGSVSPQDSPHAKLNSSYSDEDGHAHTDDSDDLPDPGALDAAYAVAMEVDVMEDLPLMINRSSPKADLRIAGNAREKTIVSIDADQEASLAQKWEAIVKAKLNFLELAKVRDIWRDTAKQATEGLKDFPETDRVSTKGSAVVPSSKGHGVMATQVLPPAKNIGHHIVSCIRRGHFGVMHPSSFVRIAWDFFGCIILAHDLVMIPLQIFESSTSGLPAGYKDFQQAFDWVSTVFWTLDICVSFMTGYFSNDGFIEMRMLPIARHYMRTWGPLDFCIVVVDWAQVVIGHGSQTSDTLRLLKTISRFMRVLRLLRFMKLSTSLKFVADLINSEYMLTMYGIFKLVVLIVVFAHYLACGWYGLARIQNDYKAWPEKFLVNDEDSIGYAYTTALHWSLTQFTPASMEVVPQNAYERCYNVVVIVIALVTFSSFVSSITSAMTHLRNINARETEQDTLIRRYFNDNKVSKELAGRVWHFLRRGKTRRGHRLKESDVPGLKVLPGWIRQELRLEVFVPILVLHPLFQAFYDLDEEAMAAVTDTAIREASHKSGEELCSTNMEPKDMFFVLHGSVEYRLGDLGRRHDLVGPGDWACEAALWAAPGLKLQAPFVAGDHGCEVVYVNGAEFQRVASSCVTSRGFLARYACLFVELFNELSQDPDCTDTLVNSKAHFPVMVTKSMAFHIKAARASAADGDIMTMLLSASQLQGAARDRFSKNLVRTVSPVA